MHQSKPRPRMAGRSVLGSLLLLGFGLFVLAFLVAIERVDWFRTHPAGGAAGAVAHPSEGAAGGTS